MFLYNIEKCNPTIYTIEETKKAEKVKPHSIQYFVIGF
jgi:hypothetical protein